MKYLMLALALVGCTCTAQGWLDVELTDNTLNELLGDQRALALAGAPDVSPCAVTLARDGSDILVTVSGPGVGNDISVSQAQSKLSFGYRSLALSERDKAQNLRFVTLKFKNGVVVSSSASIHEAATGVEHGINCKVKSILN